MRAGVNAQIVEAFEINDVANDVYQHNFGHRPFQVNPLILPVYLSHCLIKLVGCIVVIGILPSKIELFLTNNEVVRVVVRAF